MKADAAADGDRLGKSLIGGDLIGYKGNIWESDRTKRAESLLEKSPTNWFSVEFPLQRFFRQSPIYETVYNHVFITCYNMLQPLYMGVSMNGGGTPQSSILMGFSLINLQTIHSWGYPQIYGNPQLGAGVQHWVRVTIVPFLVRALTPPGLLSKKEGSTDLPRLSMLRGSKGFFKVDVSTRFSMEGKGVQIYQ